MGVFSGTIRSNVLAMDTQIHVILPYDRPAKNQRSPCRVLYLLHGLGENSAAWCRYSGIERYARSYGLAVVMPEVQKSFYADMKWGLPYLTYVAEELPDICGQMFHLSRRRADNFVAGLSMGGYGAFHCALTYPERYAAAASFSGAIDLRYIMEQDIQHPDADNPSFKAVFGLGLELEPENDLLHLAGRVALLRKSQQPRLLMTCGKQDFLHQMNAGFAQSLRTLPLELTWEDWEGDHNWNFWEQSIIMALPWLLGQ